MKFEFEEILSPLIRYCYLSSAVKNINSNKVKILEIGSFTGASLFTIAKACFYSNKNATIYCIDPFDEVFAYKEQKEGKFSDIKKVNKSHFYRFNERKKYVEKAFGVKVVHIRNYSNEVLSLFRDKLFDLIYIDGDHRYKGCKEDIINAKRIVKENGFICGDDLELSVEELKKLGINVEKEKNLQEVVVSNNLFYHPGVSLAVSEEFDEVSNYYGFWIVRKENNKFKKVSLNPDENLNLFKNKKKLIESKIIYKISCKEIEVADTLPTKAYIYPDNSVTKKFLEINKNIEIIDIIDKNLKIKNAKNIRNSNIIISSFRFFDKFYEEIDKSNRIFYLHYDDLKLYEIKEENENNN